MKKITLAIVCLLLSAPLFAAHVGSADLRYEYTGIGNVYRVILTMQRECDGAVVLPLNSVSFTSSCSPTFTRTLPQVSTSIITNYCPGNPTACNTPGGVAPGFRTFVYADTVTLDPCLDWKIIFNVSSRTASITNLMNPAATNLYIESFLNNSSQVNSSPYLPAPAFHFLLISGVNTIPLQTLDAEGDSIVYEWYQPTGNFGVPIQYSSTNYTVANPVNGQFSHDPLSQTMQIQSGWQGRFVLAVRIKDYRNGQLVGTSVRDFQVVNLNGNTALTNPMLVQGTQTLYNTCPGASNSITVNFVDSTATDSVHLTVTPPVIPGFNFNVTSLAGQGTGSATISWTTPASFNPATLPHFTIGVEAKDNGCAFGLSHYAVMVTTSQCNTDSVWAGDANGDYTVNVYDPLAVAVAYGETGPARPGATTNWQAEYCANWTTSFMNNVNKKHADCNGDGVVDNTDLAAISSNWGMVHLKGGARAKTTAVPDLYFDVSNISFHPGANVSVPVKLGSATYPMNDIYGLATNVSISGITLAAPVTISYPSSWIGNSSNTLSFTKADAMTPGDVAWAYARTDHNNTSGQGTIAMVNFTVPANALQGQQITFDFSGTEIVDNNMVTVTGYNEIDTSVLVTPLSVTGVQHHMAAAAVVPNPSKGQATLQITSGAAGSYRILVKDLTGRSVYHAEVNVHNGLNEIALPVAEIASGMYLINLSDDEGQVQSIKWIKE